MNQFNQNVKKDFQLNNIQYEHTIVVSNTILGKVEIFTLTVLSSIFYFGWFRNDIIIACNFKIICIIWQFLVLLWLGRRIFWGVKKELVFVVKSLGLQKITVYHSNFKSSMFIPWHSINDVVINEAIVMQRVIFYLAVLIKTEACESKELIIPIFIHAQPRLAELKKIYSSIQVILKS